jgi:hypothetical protein
MKSYKQETPPDPSFLLRLPNEVYSNPNIFAFQKNFDGSRKPFGFDVYYESEKSAESAWTCESYRTGSEVCDS